MRVRILFESLSTARQKYGEAIVELNKDCDPTPNFKYLEFLCKTNEETMHHNYLGMKDLLVKFGKISKNLKKKDINQYETWEELETVMKDYEFKDYKNKILNTIPKGAEKIFENNKAIVIHVDTHEASCFYGKGKFCIGNEDPTLWDDMENEGKEFFYIIDKAHYHHPQVIELEPLDDGMEWGLEHTTTGWDKTNHSVSGYKILKPLGLDKKIFNDWWNKQ